jgi:hypothetical protein
METVNAITKLELQCHTLLKELEQQLQAKRQEQGLYLWHYVGALDRVSRDLDDALAILSEVDTSIK